MASKILLVIGLLLCITGIISVSGKSKSKKSKRTTTEPPREKNQRIWGNGKPTTGDEIYPECMPPIKHKDCAYKVQGPNAFYCCYSKTPASVIVSETCEHKTFYPINIHCDCGNSLCNPGTAKPPPYISIVTDKPKPRSPKTTTTSRPPRPDPTTPRPPQPDPTASRPPQFDTTTIRPSQPDFTTFPTPPGPWPETSPVYQPSTTRKTTTKKPKPSPATTTKKPKPSPSTTTKKPKPPPASEAPSTPAAPIDSTPQPDTKVLKCFSCEATQGNAGLACKDNPKSAKIVVCQSGEVCRTLTYISEARGGSVIIRGCVKPGEEENMTKRKNKGKGKKHRKFKRTKSKGCVRNPPYLPTICEDNDECEHSSCACVCDTNLCNNVVYPGQGWQACPSH